jgi:hypothetical protein
MAHSRIELGKGELSLAALCRLLLAFASLGPTTLCHDGYPFLWLIHKLSFEVLMKWSDAPSAARARRLEALLKNEGFIP